MVNQSGRLLGKYFDLPIYTCTYHKSNIFHIYRLLAPAYDDGLMSPRSRSVQGMYVYNFVVLLGQLLRLKYLLLNSTFSP